MRAVIYLYRKNLKNRIKIALRKPITYFFLILIAFYLFALPFSLKMVVEQFSLNSSEGMAAVLTVFAGVFRQI